MAKVSFKRIQNSADIDNVPILDGQLIYTKDGKEYMDYEGERIEIEAGGVGPSTNIPAGIITSYGGSVAPDGWLICNGSAVSRATYSDLFAIIGTTYGVGDGSTTFNLPNLKGKVPVGLDNTDEDFYALGVEGGEKTHTLTTQEMPSHKHTLNFYQTGTGGNAKGVPFNAINNTMVGGDGEGVSNTGGNQPHNILQPYIVLNYIISY